MNINKKMYKKYKWFFWIGLMICSLVIVALYTLFFLMKDKNVVATVNGQPIQKLEFIAFMNQHRGDTTLAQTNLKENVLKELIRVKAIQIEGKNRGVFKNITYSSFLDDLQQENKRRKDALANKQVIYGPKQYNEQTYYSYVYSNLIHDLKDNLVKHDFELTETKLRQFYENNQGEYAIKQDRIKLKEIIEPSVNDDSLKRINVIAERIKDGESFEQIYESRIADKNFFQEETIEDSNLRDFTKYRGALYQAAMNLKIGEISQVIVDKGSYRLVLCVEREKVGYKAFDEVSSELKLRYIDIQYDLFTKQLENQAKVELKELYYQINFSKE